MMRLGRRAPNDQRTRGTNGGSFRPNDQRGFQIGPKIRIGGSVGAAAQKLKEGTGKVLSNKYVDMGLSLIPGVGPGIAAAANAAGHVLDTSTGGIHSVGDVAKIGLDAGSVYAGSKLLGGAKDALASGGVKGLLGSGLSTAKKLVSGGGSDGTGNFGAVGDMLGGAGQNDRNSLIDKLLLGGSVAAAAADRARQQKMQDQAAGYATDSYNARAPLREKGIAQMQNPATSDLADIFSNPGNVYDVQKRKPLSPAVGTASASPLRRVADTMGTEGVTVGPKVPIRKLSY